MENQEKIIVTRHGAFATYLVEIGLATANDEIIPHAGAEEIAGRHIIGTLPIHLAALCERITVVPLRIPSHLRGVELTLDQVREMAGEPATYVVKAV